MTLPEDTMTTAIASKRETRPGLAPFALKDAPSFIEKQFPVGRLSAEAYKERKANLGQTLTGLGSYWKGKRGKTRGDQSGRALARMISGRYGMAVAPGTTSRSPR